MTTARALVSTALRNLNVLAEGHTMSAEQAADGLSRLNGLLESWRLESLLVLGQLITTKVLTPNQQTYTVGSGGAINIVVPAQIESAVIRDLTQTPPLDLPLEILNDQEYASIALKQETSTYPEAVWLQKAAPLATLYLHPIPTIGHTLVLWTYGEIGSFALLDTDVVLGAGYARAIEWNLAIEYCPMHGLEVPPTVAALALEAKASVQRANTQSLLPLPDLPVGAAWRGRSFDVRTGV